MGNLLGCLCVILYKLLYCEGDVTVYTMHVYLNIPVFPAAPVSGRSLLNFPLVNW